MNLTLVIALGALGALAVWMGVGSVEYARAAGGEKPQPFVRSLVMTLLFAVGCAGFAVALLWLLWSNALP